MSKFTKLYKDENFSVDVEEEQGMVFFHCSVEKFDKGVYKQMEAVMEELKTAFTFYGFKEIYSYTQNPKFARRFGFEKINEFTKDNESYEVMLCQL